MIGLLYIVATPIGNLSDITFRAVDILKNVDFVLSEDTRHSKKLFDHYEIKSPLKAFHEHNENEKVNGIISAINSGQSVALISRRVCLAKELTKSFETIRNDNLPALIDYLESDSNHQKGEFVILVSPADKIELDEANVELEKILPILCEEMGASKAAKLASKITGLDKKYCYKKAIIL